MLLQLVWLCGLCQRDIHWMDIAVDAYSAVTDDAVTTALRICQNRSDGHDFPDRGPSSVRQIHNCHSSLLSFSKKKNQLRQGHLLPKSGSVSVIIYFAIHDAVLFHPTKAAPRANVAFGLLLPLHPFACAILECGSVLGPCSNIVADHAISGLGHPSLSHQPITIGDAYALCGCHHTPPF